MPGAGADKRTVKVTDVLKEGQVVRVKVLETDDKGRVKLSMKALLDRPEGYEERPPRERREREPREFREPREPREQREPRAAREETESPAHEGPAENNGL